MTSNRQPDLTRPLQQEQSVTVDDCPESDQSKENEQQEKPLGGGEGEAAGGVVRGLSKSVGRQVLRAPIGRLPRPSVAATKTIPRRLPVRQVAKVSDRISTSVDWWTSASDAMANDDDNKSQGSSKKAHTNSHPPKIRMLSSFTGNLVQNTLLGMVVFEGYGMVVGRLAPPTSHSDSSATRMSLIDDDDDMDEDSHHVVLQDEYARATLPAHFGAGAVAGSIHGIGTFVMEQRHKLVGGGGNKNYLWRQAGHHTLHHAVSHMILFGGYESTKRFLTQAVSTWQESHDHDLNHYESATYLGVLTLAGGLAGQFQHLVSHVTEHYLLSTNMAASGGTVAAGGGGLLLHSRWTRWLLPLPPVPALRPILYAFPPSAIGFIAFEYGKQYL